MNFQPNRRAQSPRRLFYALTAALMLAAPVIAVAAKPQTPAPDTPLLFSSPGAGANRCSSHDFGAVQIRIGLHATLRACFQDVQVKGEAGTAFITIPREFEGRSISPEQFAELRADIVATENQMYEQAKAERQGRLPVPKAKPKPIPLGIFDHDTNRVGYAYAYAVPRTGTDGQPFAQAMMRLESFVLVRDRVIVLMMITPVEGGDDAADSFDLSEQWARAIIADNQLPNLNRKAGVETSEQPTGASGKQKTDRRRVHGVA
ncbi:MAG: hypothetical protein ACRBC3_21540 [Burkholderiaceae bacterium]